MDSLVVVVRLPPAGTASGGVRSDQDAASRGAASPHTSSANDGDGSERDSSDASRVAPAADATKKRKPTYEARKEEIAAKHVEVVALREELHRLKVEQLRARQPQVLNAAIRGLVAQHHAELASAQSLIASYGAEYETPPLSTYIHLPVDPSKRQQILRELKPQKMHEALAFMVARSQFTDLNRTCRQLDDVETSRGDHVLVHWEVARITEENTTVKRVYDEMLYFKATHEMTLAEKMGVLTVRESDSCDEAADATQVRLVSTHMSGVQVEKNVVLYAQYFEQSPLLSQPHALLVADYVDRDDAFPYQPELRIRKDVSSATLAVQCPAEADKAPAVAILKWTFMRIHSSALATPDERDAISRDGVRAYHELMLASIRERLRLHGAGTISCTQ